MEVAILKSLNTGVNVSAQPSIRHGLVGRRNDYEAWARSAHAAVDFAWALDNTPERGMVQVFVGARENNPLYLQVS